VWIKPKAFRNDRPPPLAGSPYRRTGQPPLLHGGSATMWRGNNAPLPLRGRACTEKNYIYSSEGAGVRTGEVGL